MTIRLEVDEDVIRSWALPPAVTQDLLAGLKMTSLRIFGGWLIWLTMVVGFALGALFIWPYFETMTMNAAIAKAIEVDGLLYHTNFGFSLLIWLFGWIFGSAAIAGLFVRFLPQPFKSAIFLGVLCDNGGMPGNKKALLRLLDESYIPPDSCVFINEWAKLFVRPLIKYSFILFIAGSLALARETNSYAVYSETGYFSAPFFPWNKSGETPWSDAEHVELGCNQTDDGPSFIYEVYFRSGDSVRISNATPIASGHWLYSLETIDGQLARNGAEFRRWSWLNKNPLHPDCVRGYYASYGPRAGDRLMKLLRIEELGQGPITAAEGN